MTALRWHLADAERPQGALFDEPVFAREPGRGEFRGMEFLHVRAKTIINKLPPQNWLPFQYTINVYRGCSHSCSYCIHGDARILLADGRTKPIAELTVGEEIVGTERVGSYRRLVTTTVLDHWSAVKPACRVRLDDGTELVVSGDHRLLSDRGWKYVTGSEWPGPEQRPHLTKNNRLLGVGRFVDGPKKDADYRRGYLCGMVRGDAHVGHHVLRRKRGPSQTVHQFRLALTDAEPLARTATFLRDAGVETTAFVFSRATDTRRALCGIRNQRRVDVEAIESLVQWPDDPSSEWCRGFLSGIYDAEGHLGQGVRISNRDPEILDWTARCLDRFDLPHVVEPARPNGVRNVRLLGGLPTIVRFTQLIDPATTRKRAIRGRAVKSPTARRVVAVEALGIEIPMYDITTATGDYVAEGVVNHNCFARPTHSYLGLDTGDGFDRQIVVKVNAVSLLARELDPRRWAGHDIAMGTNTDPYQRCEGKYRLTRGILEVLTERANPFSILTKSTLVLRDLELLAEAAKRTDVRVNLSIGTLDEEVWRTTEPGTPNPNQRMRAVEALNTAGIPCGVLIAPVLPGLSDRPDQLEAVATAAVEAGAESVSTVMLHLRPGVREVFFERLGRTHPRLVPVLERRYRGRSDLPKADRARVSAIVHGAVRRAGGTTAPPREARHLAGEGVLRRPATRSAGPPDIAEQLPLL